MENINRNSSHPSARKTFFAPEASIREKKTPPNHQNELIQPGLHLNFDDYPAINYRNWVSLTKFPPLPTVIMISPLCEHQHQQRRREQTAIRLRADATPPTFGGKSFHFPGQTLILTLSHRPFVHWHRLASHEEKWPEAESGSCTDGGKWDN